MSSLVLELQQEALDSRGGIIDLMRKAYVVAVKLNLSQFKEWIDIELNGYIGTNIELPHYRRIYGSLRVWNPFHGFQPFFAPPEIEKIVTQMPLNIPLSEIEAIANDSSNESHVAMSFPSEIRIWLMRGMSGPAPLEPSLLVSRTAFTRILNAVRDAVLKWSLELEKNGIVGEGMSFTAEEKKIAAQKEGELARIVNITIIGQMSDSSLQQGSERAKQDYGHRK
jgi:hypothetical protein